MWVCLNGAAARKAQVGDTVIIIAYAMMTKEEAQNLVPDVVMVDEHNRPVRVRGTETWRRNWLIYNIILNRIL